MRSRFKNWQELNKSPRREAALAIAEAGLKSIDTSEAIKKNVRLEAGKLYLQDEIIDLNAIERLFFVGIGKCALAAGETAEEILGERLDGGIVLTPEVGQPLTRLRVLQGDHPLPSERNVGATKEILNLLSSLTEKDLVIFVISGGGSTLLCQPANFTCLDETGVVEKLFAAGATIREINTLRKHLSLARGGGLAAAAYPARVVSLIFSDVPGDDLSVISSGPTVKDETTIADAQAIINRYGLAEADRFELIETPKDDKFFTRVKNLLIVSNRLALEAMTEKARSLGFEPEICTATLQGEARQVGEMIIQELHNRAPRTALLYGGETTVKVRGMGRGGRNQELALAALPHIQKDELVLSFASDGRDNSDFAGALVDVLTQERASELNLSPDTYLQNNNSYEFFAQTGDYLLTSPTGVNVSDLIIALRA